MERARRNPHPVRIRGIAAHMQEKGRLLARHAVVHVPSLGRGAAVGNLSGRQEATGLPISQHSEYQRHLEAGHTSIRLRGAHHVRSLPVSAVLPERSEGIRAPHIRSSFKRTPGAKRQRQGKDKDQRASAF